MKQIVAWVNKWDRKQLEKHSDYNIHFSSSLDDFDLNLCNGCFPLLSITKAGKYWRKLDIIIGKHENLIFYFTEKIDKPMTYGELRVQERDNVYHPMSPLPDLLEIYSY
jgi:hypothetical protein